MKSIPYPVQLPCGFRASVDYGEPIEDFVSFEIANNVCAGKRYKIKDEWNAIEDYIYLGHGWSAAYLGGATMIITPSRRPHYTTSPNGLVPDEVIRELIEIVNSKHEPEMDMD